MLARFEIAAVILGLPETNVELPGNRLAFNGHQRHVAVMDQIIEPEQSVAKRILDLELRTPGCWGNAQIIHQWPDDAVPVFNVIQARRAQQIPDPAIGFHGALPVNSTGKRFDLLLFAFQHGFKLGNQMLQAFLGFGHCAFVGCALVSQVVYGFAIAS